MMYKDVQPTTDDLSALNTKTIPLETCHLLNGMSSFQHKTI